MPPKAAPNGNMAFLNCESSPVSSSLFISVAASTKKKAIPKLLIHSMGEPGSLREEKTPEGIAPFQNLLNQPVLEKLVVQRERMVQHTRSTPVVLLSLSKSLSGVKMWWKGFFLWRSPYFINNYNIIIINLLHKVSNKINRKSGY